MQAPITEAPSGTFADFDPDKANATITAARAEQNTPGFTAPTVTDPASADRSPVGGHPGSSCRSG